MPWKTAITTLANIVQDCGRSRTAWLLASLHAAWCFLAIANMPAPAPGLGEFLDRGGGSSATLLAGRPFHFSYESPLCGGSVLVAWQSQADPVLGDWHI